MSRDHDHYEVRFLPGDDMTVPTWRVGAETLTPLRDGVATLISTTVIRDLLDRVHEDPVAIAFLVTWESDYLGLEEPKWESVYIERDRLEAILAVHEVSDLPGVAAEAIPRPEWRLDLEEIVAVYGVSVGSMAAARERQREALAAIERALPPTVTVLDLETRNPGAVKQPDTAEIALVGLIAYRREGDGYRAGEYEHFLLGEFDRLQARLDELDGIILGHNLFEFDYRVLRQHLNLEHIIERSVDTLHFLYDRNGGRLKGLSLDSLAGTNLGARKTIPSKTIPQLLKAGKLDEVRQHNAEDLDLTFRVWWHMFSDRGVTIDCQVIDEATTFCADQNELYLAPSDLDELIGCKPAFTYETWVKSLSGGRRDAKRSRRSQKDRAARAE